MISVTATVLDGAQEQIYKEISLLISVLTDTERFHRDSLPVFGQKSRQNQKAVSQHLLIPSKIPPI